MCENNSVCECLMKALQIRCFVTEIECAPGKKEIVPSTELIALMKCALLFTAIKCTKDSTLFFFSFFKLCAGLLLPRLSHCRILCGSQHISTQQSVWLVWDEAQSAVLALTVCPLQMKKSVRFKTHRITC